MKIKIVEYPRGPWPPDIYKAWTGIVVDAQGPEGDPPAFLVALEDMVKALRSVGEEHARTYLENHRRQFDGPNVIKILAKYCQQIS